MIEKREKKISVKQYGNALLLHSVMKGLIPSLKAFESWREVYALALVRIMGYTPLKRVKTAWEKLYMDIRPNLNPKKLSSVLKEVGLDREGQGAVFKALMNERNFIYDLSVVFTRSSINLAETGYNKDGIHLPQINLALLYSMKGLPAMIRALPGSIRDITSLYNTVEEIRSNFNSELILILDRGSFSEEAMDFLLDKGLSFVIPARRNSRLYGVEIEINEHFFYRERLIKAGKGRSEKFYLYLFEDVTLRAEEEINLYRMLDDGKISREELDKRLERAGKILLISDLDLKPEDIFLIYKQRGSVEKAFDAYKNLLHADRITCRAIRLCSGIYSYLSLLSMDTVSSR